MQRGLWLAAGVICLGLGIVGAFLPLLPTTVFIIMAAACFARSSPRLEAWLLADPRFGPSIRRWRERGAIPVPAKAAALIGMSLGLLVFWYATRPSSPVFATAVTLIAGCAAYVLSRPST